MTSERFINDSEIKISFVRSPGPGGQNVNKLATTAQLRFNVLHSTSLPVDIRLRVLSMLGKRITRDGDLVIKASRYRTQERNKQDAIDRLMAILKRAAVIRKKRKKTKPTRASSERRLTTKKLHGKTKLLRRNNSSKED